MLTTATPILGKATHTVAQVFGWAKANGAVRLDFLGEYLTELYALAAVVGVNADLAAMQSAHETGDPLDGRPWRSDIWATRGNPAGMGVTDGADQGLSFATGALAARAHLAHLLLYATGTIDRAPLSITDDPRYDAYVKAYGHVARATTLAGLAGTWATDPAYATQIVAKATSALGPDPVLGITFGRVPHPAFRDRLVLDHETGAWNNLGQKTVEGVVWHRMLGTLLGTDSWFRRGIGVSDGLTEYGVGVTQDGTNDGVIYRWNDPLGRPHDGVSADRSPWASGPVSAPYGDGKAFLDDHDGDLNVVNRNQAAIEISGNYDTPLSTKARGAVVALTAYWADRAGIPWHTFPIIPGKGYSFVRWHQEFTIGTGKVCPGSVVMNATTDMFADVSILMRQYQEDLVPAPTYVQPTPIPMIDGTDHLLDGLLYFAIVRKVKITADKATFHASASVAAKQTRSPMVRGQSFEVVFALKAIDANWWYVTRNGSRVLMSQCSPKAVFQK